MVTEYIKNIVTSLTPHLAAEEAKKTLEEQLKMENNEIESFSKNQAQNGIDNDQQIAEEEIVPSPQMVISNSGQTEQGSKQRHQKSVKKELQSDDEEEQEIIPEIEIIM